MKKYILIIVASLLTVQCFGQASVSDELKTLVNAALNYQPRIKQAEQTVNLNALKVDMATSAYLPTVNADAGYTYLNPRTSATFSFGGRASTLYFTPVNNYAAKVSLNWSVWDFGKTKANIEKAKADVQGAKDNLEAARAAYAYQVAKIYYAIIYFKQAILVNNEEINSLNDNKKIVMARINNGDATDFDKLTMEVRINTAQNKKGDLENMLQQYLTLLQSLTGNSDKIRGTEIEINTTTVMPTQGAATNNWEIVAAKDKTVATEAECRSAGTYMYPSLDIFGNAGYKNGYINDNDLNRLYFNQVAGASINWNIFAGNRAKKAYELSRISVDLAKLDEQNAELNVRRDLSVNAPDINTLIDKYNTLPTQVQQAKDALTLAESRYKNGVIREIELIDAQTNLKETQLLQLQYQYQLCVAQLERNRLLGVKFW